MCKLACLCSFWCQDRLTLELVLVSLILDHNSLLGQLIEFGSDGIKEFNKTALGRRDHGSMVVD